MAARSIQMTINNWYFNSRRPSAIADAARQGCSHAFRRDRKQATRSKGFLIAAFAVLLGSTSLHAQENILVASTASNSLERFTPTGTWVGTFATTGRYSPNALAQSPLTGEIFVTTSLLVGGVGGTILRYHANGQFDTNWDTFTVVCPATAACQPQTQSLLFDSSGNLWVATAFGQSAAPATPPTPKNPSGTPAQPLIPIYIFKYLAANLTQPNPPAQPHPIVTNMIRGNQMAFDKGGNLCIAGFIDEDVRCFDTSTGVQTKDYSAELKNNGFAAIEPAGLAFDADGRLYLDSVFKGQVVKEVNPGGPMVLLAQVVSPPPSPNQHLLNGNLLLRPGVTAAPKLYLTTYYNPPPTSRTPDAAYEVSTTTGTVTNFIVGLSLSRKIDVPDR